MKIESDHGQISFMLILGALIILFAILLVFVPFKKQASRGEASDPAFSFITACLEQSGADAIQTVGQMGGTTDGKIGGVTDGKSHGVLAIPPSSEIERAISLQTREYLPVCYHDFIELRKQGIRVTAGDPRVSATITKEGVSFRLDQAITLEQAASPTKFTKQSNTFYATVETPLLDVIREARELQLKHPEGIDITGLVRKNMNATLFVEAASRRANWKSNNIS